MHTVFLDVDTQIDFLFAAGALYVPGGEALVPVIARLNQFAAAHGIPVISDTDAHIENDPEFRVWPPHCVVGTTGQQKPTATRLDRQAIVPEGPAQLNIDGASQVIVQKRVLDVFGNPNFPALLDLLNAERYVVYGVVTEYCVRYAALGLLKTGKPVSLVVDAIRALDSLASARTIDEFTGLGGTLTSVAEIGA